jgi:hypothetical protein
LDAKSREWTIRLSAGDLARIREECGIPLGKLLTHPELVADIMLCDVETASHLFWVCCERQANEQGVSKLDFLNAIEGPQIEKGTEAVLRSVIDFFPRSRIAEKAKERLTQFLEKMDQAWIEATEKTPVEVEVKPPAETSTPSE